MGDLWLAVRWLHVLAMAFFVGGQLLLAVAVVPVERRAPDRERLRAIARRFGYGTLMAIAVLLATGSAMASRFTSGQTARSSSSWRWSRSSPVWSSGTCVAPRCTSWRRACSASRS